MCSLSWRGRGGGGTTDKIFPPERVLMGRNLHTEARFLSTGPEPGSGKVRLPLCDVHLDPVFELRGLLPMQAGLAGWRARRLASGMLSGVLLTT